MWLNPLLWILAWKNIFPLARIFSQTVINLQKLPSRRSFHWIQVSSAGKKACFVLRATELCVQICWNLTCKGLMQERVYAANWVLLHLTPPYSIFSDCFLVFNSDVHNLMRLWKLFYRSQNHSLRRLLIP